MLAPAINEVRAGRTALGLTFQKIRLVADCINENRCYDSASNSKSRVNNFSLFGVDAKRKLLLFRLQSVIVSENFESPVDVEQVKKNALAQGIALQQIAILYVGLSDDEKDVFRALDLLKTESDNLTIATFTNDGDALFPKKITGVQYLAAD
jgi:hypothetical protein